MSLKLLPFIFINYITHGALLLLGVQTLLSIWTSLGYNIEIFILDMQPMYQIKQILVIRNTFQLWLFPFHFNDLVFDYNAVLGFEYLTRACKYKSLRLFLNIDE